MKSQPNPDSSRPAAGSNSSGGHPATVPLSIYRELSAELQATKAMLDSLNTQNQQLTRQNQQFRHEIERLMQVSINLQQIAGLPSASWAQPSEMAPPSAPPLEVLDGVPVQLRQTKGPAGKTPAQTPPLVETQPLVEERYETEPVRPQRIQPQGGRDLSGLWLWLTVLVIIVTAFGAGFMVVRPLLPQR